MKWILESGMVKILEKYIVVIIRNIVTFLSDSVETENWFTEKKKKLSHKPIIKLQRWHHFKVCELKVKWVKLITPRGFFFPPPLWETETILGVSSLFNRSRISARRVLARAVPCLVWKVDEKNPDTQPRACPDSGLNAWDERGTELLRARAWPGHVAGLKPPVRTQTSPQPTARAAVRFPLFCTNRSLALIFLNAHPRM